MHCESKARYLLRIWLYFYFLRAVVNISIQTLLFSPWLLFRKMIISQLDLGLPVVDLETALGEWGERFHRRSPEWFIKQLQSLSLLYSPNDPVSTFIVNLSVWGCFVFFCLLSSCCAVVVGHVMHGALIIFLNFNKPYKNFRCYRFRQR